MSVKKARRKSVLKTRKKKTMADAPAGVAENGKALARERDVLKAIMENAGTMMAYFDPEFNFLLANTAYARGAGHAVEELVGKNHFALFTNEENQAIFEKVRDTGEPVTLFDKPFELADKPERGVTYWDWTLVPVKDEAGRVQGLILSLLKPTQRKRAEEEILAMSRFPSENPYPVMRISRDGTILYCNPSGLPMLEEWKCQIGQLAPERWCQLVADVFRSGVKKEFEEEYGTRTFSFVLAPIAEAGYVNVYGRDITERKKAEEKILLAKNEWERTFDSIPDLVAIVDKEHRIVRANKAMAQRLGLSPDQCVGLNCFKCVHKLDEPLSFCPHSLSLADGKEHTAEIHEENLGGDFLVSTSPLFDQSGQVIGSVHVARDITERKEGEQALRESEIDLNRAQAVAKTGSWRLDVRRDELVWSAETYRMFGIPKGTPLTYETFLANVHPDDRAYVDEKWQAATRGESYDIEHRIVVNGEIRWVREKAELEFDKDGALLGGFGTVQEITELKRMEQELRDSLDEARRRESEISALLTASKVVLQHRQFQNAARLIFDSCKRLLGATSGYIALLSNDEMKNEVLFLDSEGLPCTVDPTLPMPVRGLRAEAYGTGKAVYHNDFPNSEWAKLMPKGHMILKNVLFAPLKIEGKTVGLIGIANKPKGFTERDAHMALAFSELASIALINSKNLESLEDNQKRLKEYSQHLEEMVEERTKKLQDAQRLATIGETAGMVGHDIRNPLQTIEGAIYLGKEELKSEQLGEQQKTSLHETLDTIERQTQYIDKIVSDLQDFSRTPLPQPRTVNLHETVTDSICTSGIPENIEVSTLVQEDLQQVILDPIFMERILKNLIKNAAQAMPNGGTLTIRAHKKDQEIILTVKDTGQGILEENKPRIFEPLFTTKAKGQGFGLAVCKRLTEAHGGSITFESQEGIGTTFTVRIPQTSRP